MDCHEGRLFSGTVGPLLYQVHPVVLHGYPLGEHLGPDCLVLHCTRSAKNPGLKILILMKLPECPETLRPDNVGLMPKKRYFGSHFEALYVGKATRIQLQVSRWHEQIGDPLGSRRSRAAPQDFGNRSRPAAGINEVFPRRVFFGLPSSSARRRRRRSRRWLKHSSRRVNACSSWSTKVWSIMESRSPRLLSAESSPFPPHSGPSFHAGDSSIMVAGRGCRLTRNGAWRIVHSVCVVLFSTPWSGGADTARYGIDKARVERLRYRRRLVPPFCLTVPKPFFLPRGGPRGAQRPIAAAWWHPCAALAYPYAAADGQLRIAWVDEGGQLRWWEPEAARPLPR
jgi:hypothetical protein